MISCAGNHKLDFKSQTIQIKGWKIFSPRIKYCEATMNDSIIRKCNHKIYNKCFDDSIGTKAFDYDLKDTWIYAYGEKHYADTIQLDKCINKEVFEIDRIGVFRTEFAALVMQNKSTDSAISTSPYYFKELFESVGVDSANKPYVLFRQ
jgi:hypothetical protein